MILDCYNNDDVLSTPAVKLAALALVGVGCWAFSEKNRLTERGVSVNESLQSKYSDVFAVVFDLTILVITLAVVIFVLSFVGCVGALRENTCFLKCVRSSVAAVRLNALVVSALGIRTRGPGFDSRVVPLFHWACYLLTLPPQFFSSMKLGYKRVFSARAPEWLW